MATNNWTRVSGDVTPIDQYSHFPALAEEKGIPYVFVPCKHSLALAGGHRGVCVCALIVRDESYGVGILSCIQSDQQRVEGEAVLE